MLFIFVVIQSFPIADWTVTSTVAFMPLLSSPSATLIGLSVAVLQRASTYGVSSPSMMLGMLSTGVMLMFRWASVTPARPGPRPSWSFASMVTVSMPAKSFSGVYTSSARAALMLACMPISSTLSSSISISTPITEVALTVTVPFLAFTSTFRGKGIGVESVTVMFDAARDRGPLFSTQATGIAPAMLMTGAAWHPIKAGVEVACASKVFCGESPAVKIFSMNNFMGSQLSGSRMLVSVNFTATGPVTLFTPWTWTEMTLFALSCSMNRAFHEARAPDPMNSVVPDASVIRV
mmetsp:Transcript_29579/g.50238  ORF Transcript_29579/g.50238 Transcript_29579/m.50238 type:complete len:292 (+) Transcript_29579:1300-2175(+)